MSKHTLTHHRRPRTALAAALLAMTAAASLALPAHAARKEPYCGNLDNAYGPYDYRKGATELEFNLKLVEGAHFTADVENGIKGRSSTLAGDIDYTLRAFPNHAVALSTVIRVASRDKKSLFLPGGTRPVECYFDRAVRFAPDDPSTHTLYGSYLLSVGREAEALLKYQTAVQLDPDNPSTNYNLGLVYYKNKDMVNANKYAQIAYALEFPLPGLKNLLVQAGKWDPSAAPAPESLKKKGKGEEAAAAEEGKAPPAPDAGKADAPGQAAPATPAAAPATQPAPAAPAKTN
ncbi:type IV pilus biogenesis/stability protein PilW [Massilia sp. Root351]|uniref:tetratricopeptide repeat protein n=1 Tax=Massilia sp. Root351 TaxID=1736522 RepID=UPI000B20AC0E|nr:tetratricopeptide repeat protein [Massilia sp. Root351]